MDWLTFIVEFTRAVAWPGTIVVILLLLRRPILKLIPEISKFKWKDLEIDFQKKLDEVTKQAETVLPKIVTSSTTVQIEAVQAEAEGKAAVYGEAEIVDTDDRFIRLAELSPPAAIIEAWLEVEDSVRIAATRLGIAINERTNLGQLMNRLLSLEKIDRPTYAVFENLRGMRNSAAHARSTDLTTNQSLDYRQIAKRLAAKLRSLT